MKIVLHAETLKDAGFLRKITHAQLGTFVHGQFGDFLAMEPHRSFVGVDHANNHAKRRRLAGAVATEQADNFAGMDPKAKLIDNGSSAVALHQAFCFQEDGAICAH